MDSDIGEWRSIGYFPVNASNQIDRRRSAHRHRGLSGFPVQCLHDGFYIAGSAGAYFREDFTATAHAVNNPAITGPFRREYDPGVALNVSVGYHLPFRLRAELEFGYTRYTIAKDIFGAPFNSTTRFPSGAVATRYSGTANLFYDLPLGDSVVPYIGGGIGGARSESTGSTGIDTFGRRPILLGGSTTRGVALLEGGLTIALNQRLALVPAYRWTRVFGGGGVGATEAAHAAKIGLRYAF